MPLSLTSNAPEGMCSASRSEVSSVTSKVVRSRLLTPMISAPEAMAASSSARLWTSTSAAMRYRAASSRKSRISRSVRMAAINRIASAVRGGFDDLRWCDCEILAQRRKLDCGAGRFEIDEVALEVRRIGEDGNRGGAARLIGARDAGGLEIGGENAAAGGCFLDLGDDGRDLRAQGGAKIAAAGEARFGGGFPRRKRSSRHRHFFAFGGDNSGQNVWNGFDQGCPLILTPCGAGAFGPPPGFAPASPAEPNTFRNVRLMRVAPVSGCSPSFRGATP